MCVAREYERPNQNRTSGYNRETYKGTNSTCRAGGVGVMPESFIKKSKINGGAWEVRSRKV